MNWIERGNIEDIENLHNMDRPRAVAAMVLLAEIVLVYWFSAMQIPQFPAGVPGGTHRARLVPLASILVLPAMPPNALPSDVVVTKDENAPDENRGTGGDNPDSTSVGAGDSDNGGVPDDIRIVSIVPPPTIGLWVGDTVNFEVTVEYNLASAGSSTVSMLIEECSCDPPPSQVLPVSLPRSEPARFRSRVSASAARGRRTQVVSKRIRIPVAQLLNVSVRLGDENSSTGPTDTKVYRVADGGRPATGAQNTVRITSVRPAPGSPLRIGDAVDFEVAVDYNVPGDSATLGLQIDGGGQSALQVAEPVKRGQRRLVFRERVQIPGSTLTITARLGDAEARETVEFKTPER
jgi:hypothetical protein